MKMEFDGDGPPRTSIGGTKPGDPPPGTRTANVHNADPSMSGLDLAGDEHGTWYAVRNGRKGNTIVHEDYDEVMRQADGVKKAKGRRRGCVLSQARFSQALARRHLSQGWTSWRGRASRGLRAPPCTLRR